MLKKKYWVVVGSRQEAIKQIPVYTELLRQKGQEQVALLTTGQDHHFIEQVLRHFNVQPDAGLDILRNGDHPTEASASVLYGLNNLLRLHTPEWMIIQGDTTTAAMSAIAGFQHRVRIAHHEAGLRTYDLESPFPEEANRRWISAVADLHFAPTPRAKDALLGEGIPEDCIQVTGNTGIDALKWTLERPRPRSIDFVLRSLQSKCLRPVLLTARGRERSSSVEDWFRALSHFLRLNPALGLIYPVHPDPMSQAAAEKYLRPLAQVHLIAPLNYGESCHLLAECDVVVTDSSGVQEEAATLGIPTVVCRKNTERMEAVELGIARVAGTEADSILSALAWAVAQGRPQGTGLRNFMYGDGGAARRMVDLL